MYNNTAPKTEVDIFQRGTGENENEKMVGNDHSIGSPIACMLISRLVR